MPQPPAATIRLPPLGPARRAAALALALTLPAAAAAQAADQTGANAVVPSLGEVLALSPLQPGAREPGGDLNVHGTISVRHNGPHRLQVRLSGPHTSPGPGGSQVTNDVYARVDDELLLLGTGNWVTVATGPGTPGLVHPVSFLVAWGPGAPRRPADALDLPLAYQVIPLESDGSP